MVEKAAHTTGGAFHGFARLVAKFGKQCRMVYLENVVSLQDRDRRTGRSNYDGVADVVRSLGLVVCPPLFCSGRGFAHLEASALHGWSTVLG